MKKSISLFMATVLAVLLVPASTLASSSLTDVSGVINFNGVHVGKGVKVTVSCNGHTVTGKTDKSGTYLVQFKKSQCKTKDTITVTATVNGITATSTAKADKETCRLNVAIINVSVPEYGLIGLTGAAITGSGAFFLIRRRQLSGPQA